MTQHDALKPLHILLAEDDSDDHLLFADALASFRLPYYQLSRVTDGEETIQFLLKESQFRYDRKSAPDLIVLDLNMPRMDGFEFLERFRKITHLKDIPVYVLTISKQAQTMERCRQLGARACYHKPAGRKELESILKDILTMHELDLSLLS